MDKELCTFIGKIEALKKVKIHAMKYGTFLLALQNNDAVGIAFISTFCHITKGPDTIFYVDVLDMDFMLRFGTNFFTPKKKEMMILGFWRMENGDFYYRYDKSHKLTIRAVNPARVVIPRKLLKPLK